MNSQLCDRYVFDNASGHVNKAETSLCSAASKKPEVKNQRPHHSFHSSWRGSRDGAPGGPRDPNAPGALRDAVPAPGNSPPPLPVHSIASPVARIHRLAYEQALRISRRGVLLLARSGRPMIAPIRNLLCVFAALALIAGVSAPAAAQPAPAAAQPMPKPRPAASDKAKLSDKTKITTDTKVYLLRGLLNIFSLGMDALSDKLNAMGITSEVFNHDSWPQVASRIIDDHKAGKQGAVVLIGHSLGADVLFNLTERLERENIPVRLVVPFDPTSSYEVTKNVDHLLNFYQLNGFGRRVGAPKGLQGPSS